MSFTAPTAEVDVVPTGPLADPVSTSLAIALREMIWTAQSADPRSMQKEVGWSELGNRCERSLAYKAHEVPATNFEPDPLKTMMGHGFHKIMADAMGLFNHSGRFMIEVPLSYRGIPGTTDLYDQMRKTVFDWKSTSKSKLYRIRTGGPSSEQQVQAHGYGTALKAQGYAVERVALVFFPREGTLNDMLVWSAPLDTTIADAAVDRYERIAALPLADVSATPSPLCPWCDHYQPNSTDLLRGCPGNSSTNNAVTKG